MTYFSDFVNTFQNDTNSNPEKIRDAIVGVLAQYVVNRSSCILNSTNDQHLILVCGLTGKQLNDDTNIESIILKSTSESLISRLISLDTNKPDSLTKLQSIMENTYKGNWQSKDPATSSQFKQGKLSGFLHRLNYDPTSPLRSRNLTKIIAQFNKKNFKNFKLKLTTTDYAHIGKIAIDKLTRNCCIVQTSYLPTQPEFKLAKQQLPQLNYEKSAQSYGLINEHLQHDPRLFVKAEVRTESYAAEIDPAEFKTVTLSP